MKAFGRQQSCIFFSFSSLLAIPFPFPQPSPPSFLPSFIYSRVAPGSEQGLHNLVSDFQQQLCSTVWDSSFSQGIGEDSLNEECPLLSSLRISLVTAMMVAKRAHSPLF